MMRQLPTLAHLLKQLQQVPYLASKNLYRVAHHLLQMDAAQFEQFSSALAQAKEQVVKCTRCFTWQERSMACPFCDDPRRDHQIICVVETWHEVCAIEKTGGFQGVYHVLGGVLYPLEGVGPEDLTIEQLVARVQTGCAEVILAMNQTPEGEATSAFIACKVTHTQAKVKITCLSRGLPVGASIELMDRVTVFKALAERRIF